MDQKIVIKRVSLVSAAWVGMKMILWFGLFCLPVLFISAFCSSTATFDDSGIWCLLGLITSVSTGLFRAALWAVVLMAGVIAGAFGSAFVAWFYNLAAGTFGGTAIRGAKLKEIYNTLEIESVSIDWAVKSSLTAVVTGWAVFTGLYSILPDDFIRNQMPFSNASYELFRSVFAYFPIHLVLGVLTGGLMAYFFNRAARRDGGLTLEIDSGEAFIQDGRKPKPDEDYSFANNEPLESGPVWVAGIPLTLMWVLTGTTLVVLFSIFFVAGSFDIDDSSPLGFVDSAYKDMLTSFLGPMAMSFPLFMVTGVLGGVSCTVFHRFTAKITGEIDPSGKFSLKPWRMSRGPRVIFPIVAIFILVLLVLRLVAWTTWVNDFDQGNLCVDGSTDIPQQECEVLAVLFDAKYVEEETQAISESNHDLEDWLNWLFVGEWTPYSEPPRTVRLCARSGVQCAGGHVITLRLIDPELSGQIPSELGNLTGLQTLRIRDTQLSGPIPPELGNLTNLEVVEIVGTPLSGPIPPELGNLINLEELYLQTYQLSGPIPPELGNLANLQHLDLANNNLSGPIPPELGNLASLQHMDLSDNDLSGPIPPKLGNLSDLRDLDMSDNDLSGQIPPELSNLVNLIYLRLYSNHLSGEIPCPIACKDPYQVMVDPGLVFPDDCECE